MGIKEVSGANLDYYEMRDFYSLLREFFGYYKYTLVYKFETVIVPKPNSKIIKFLFFQFLQLLLFMVFSILSVLFQYLVLGWGSSGNSPNFNILFNTIIQVVVLAVLAKKKKRWDMAIASLLVIVYYLAMLNS